MLITFLASYLIWILVVGVIYLWFVDGRVTKEVALHAAVAFVLAWGAAAILKIIFDTPRPFITDSLVPLTLLVPQDAAFPSAHTASAFALAISVWRHNKKIGGIFIIAAIVIGVARVLAHVHWPIDILGGAVVGTVVSLAVERLHVFPLLKK